MEGKAVLLDQFVGLSGIPILLNTSDPDEIVETVKHIHKDLEQFYWRTLALHIASRLKKD